MRWFVWNLPVRLGGAARFIGGTVDDISSWIIGIAILLMLLTKFLGLFYLHILEKTLILDNSYTYYYVLAKMYKLLSKELRHIESMSY